MKQLVCLFSLLLTSLIFAEDPPELVTLREAYKEEIQRVSAGTSKKYLGALERLQKSYTAANKLEEALAVRDSIEKARTFTKDTVDALANLTGEIKPKSEDEKPEVKMPPAPEPEEDTGFASLRKWKGDGDIKRKDGEEIILIEADLANSRKFEQSFETRDLPNGTNFVLQYRTSDYVGSGMKLKGYYNARDFFFRPVPFVADGEWHEANYRHETTKYNGSAEIRIQVEVLGGTGSVEFKELKVKDL